jgi:hypothetical protein
MKNLTLCLILLLLTGCSVGMAMSGTEIQDTSILFLGAPRHVVMTKIGPPETSTKNEDGERIDSYLITKGNEPSIGRAAVHAGLDVLSFGLWEVVGTPLEMGAGRENKSRYIILYDKDDKIKDIQRITGATKVEGE